MTGMFRTAGRLHSGYDVDQVDDFFERARRVYEKVGFTLEGTKREALRYADGWVDCHVMAILAQDWRGPHAPGSPAHPATPAPRER